MSGDHAAARLVDFDGRKLVNALTLLWLACLVPVDPLGENRLFTASVFAFMTAAIVNHLFPARWPGLSHVVKALYSLLLVQTARIDLRWAPALMAADLAPLASTRLAPVEHVGAACRVACVALAFHRVHWNPPLVAFFAAMSAVYFVERRARIRRGRRHEYGWFHHFEHLAIVALLFLGNADRFDVHDTWIRIAVAPFILFALMTLGGLLINRSLAHGRLPAWFDPRVEAPFREKLARNVRSTKLYNYFLKPFDHVLTVRKVTWAEIESIIDAVPVREPVDEVVGVLSGGAFIAAYVARRNGVPRVSYMRSSYWSHNDLPTMAVKIAKHLAGRPVMTDLHFPPDFDVAGKSVLLVDDTVCTAATVDSISAELRRRGARRVIRFALFCNPQAEVEYAGVRSAAPLIWPWGWESD